MKKIKLVSSFFFFLCICSIAFAGTMTVETGFGYLTDSQGHVISKYVLAPGQHPITDGYTQTEVANQSALDVVVVWAVPIDPIDAFSVLEFQTDIFALLPALSDPSLRLEFGALNTFATNKDFAGMQQYLGFLLLNEIATQDDVDAVLGCVTKQGITLA
jgi:hypothetical protein